MAKLSQKEIDFHLQATDGDSITKNGRQQRTFPGKNWGNEMPKCNSLVGTMPPKSKRVK